MKATFANRRKRLWPHEFVNARVVLSVRHHLSAVAEQTVQQTLDGYFAGMVNPGDTVERRAIAVETIQNGLAIVTGGLKPGEQGGRQRTVPANERRPHRFAGGARRG